MSDQVIQKIGYPTSNEKVTPPRWVEWLINQWYARRILVVSLASVLAIFFAGSLWWMTAKPSTAIDFSQVHPREARSYLLSCAGDLDDVQLSLLNDESFDSDFIPITEEELQGVIDDYLYQLPSENQLN